MKVSIKGVKVSYRWRWRLKEEICGICQQPFEQMCSECTHPIDCTPCVGVCGHSYHKHCIDMWNTTNTQCPICRSPWTPSSTLPPPEALEGCRERQVHN